MADESGSDAGPSWRVSGWRLWLYVLLLVLFLLQTGLRLFALLTEPPPHDGDGLLLAFALVGTLCYGLIVVQHRRTRVTLLAGGVEIRSLRRRVLPYADIERAHRSRWSRGTVTLDLLDASKVVLPAPVAGLKDPAPELDEAVALIDERVAAARRPVGDGEPG